VNAGRRLQNRQPIITARHPSVPPQDVLQRARSFSTLRNVVNDDAMVRPLRDLFKSSAIATSGGGSRRFVNGRLGGTWRQSSISISARPRCRRSSWTLRAGCCRVSLESGRHGFAMRRVARRTSGRSSRRQPVADPDMLTKKGVRGRDGPVFRECDEMPVGATGGSARAALRNRAAFEDFSGASGWQQIVAWLPSPKCTPVPSLMTADRSQARPRRHRARLMAEPRSVPCASPQVSPTSRPRVRTILREPSDLSFLRRAEASDVRHNWACACAG
jgi:hypothetical protein